MGKFSEATNRTPPTSSLTFKNDDVYVGISSYLKEKINMVCSPTVTLIKVKLYRNI
jgi:hypothetical protein